MDYSLPGSSVHGILQTRILEWLAISFSRDLPDPGSKPGPPAQQTDSLLSEPPGKLLWVVKLGKGYLGALMGLWSGSLRPRHLPRRNVSSAHWLCPAAPTWSGSQGRGGVLRISTPELCPGQALRPWGTKAKGIRDPAASQAPGHLPLGPYFVLKADPVPDEMGWEGPEQTVLRNRPVSPPLWQAQLRAGFSR